MVLRFALNKRAPVNLNFTLFRVIMDAITGSNFATIDEKSFRLPFNSKQDVDGNCDNKVGIINKKEHIKNNISE